MGSIYFYLVFLAIPMPRPLYMKKQNKVCLFYLYATAKSEIQICSNKLESGLVEMNLSAEKPNGQK